MFLMFFLICNYSFTNCHQNIIFVIKNSYISFLYEVMFTPTMVEKIIKLVEENYLDDIEKTDDDKKKYYTKTVGDNTFIIKTTYTKK